MWGPGSGPVWERRAACPSQAPLTARGLTCLPPCRLSSGRRGGPSAPRSPAPVRKRGRGPGPISGRPGLAHGSSFPEVSALHGHGRELVSALSTLGLACRGQRSGSLTGAPRAPEGGVSSRTTCLLALERGLHCVPGPSSAVPSPERASLSKTCDMVARTGLSKGQSDPVLSCLEPSGSFPGWEGSPPAPVTHKAP